MQNKMTMKKLFSCYTEGCSDVLCLCLRSIFLFKASQTIKRNTWVNMDPSPSWTLTSFSIYTKSICFVRLKFAVSPTKHFNALTLGILGVGLHPSIFIQLPLRTVFRFGLFCVVFPGMFKSQNDYYIFWLLSNLPHLNYNSSNS